MITHININVRARRLSFVICHLSFGLALTGLTACSDWRDGIADDDPATASPTEIAFRATVVTGSMATRADGSIVNLNETSLPETKERSYWRYNPTTKLVEEEKETFQVGVFGCYTGQYKWADLQQAYTDAYETYKGGDPEKNEETFLASSAFSTFAATGEGKAYSANLLYNQPADIAAPISGVNTLSYTPLRFWPNQKHTESGTDTYDYATFWAYYPYNPTAIPGTYGISINSNTMGQGMGMGRVTFTMHPDAAQQNDFMISMPVTDCNRDTHPLRANSTLDGFEPTPVRFRFYHMLAQVRLYAFIRGTDKIVYATKGGNTLTVKSIADGTSVTLTDGENDYLCTTTTAQFVDAWGVEQTLAVGDKVPDDTSWLSNNNDVKPAKIETVRWARTPYYDIRGEKKRANIHYKMEFNNIKTAATFFPKYTNDGVTINYTDATTLGSATVNHYIMNPYWFRFDDSNKKDLHRYMLNDDYMYGEFEDTPVYKRENTTTANGGLDGIDWSDSKWSSLYTGDASSPTTTPLHYLDLTGSDWTLEHELGVPGTEISGASDTEKLFSKHYNYPPGNILMVVPQVLSDDDVPHIVITATGKDTNGNDISAKVTVNLLQMNLKWESGFIYSYAFIDELKPGDDIVRGPESITVVFDTSKHTDQW